jgi:outer membrane lipoprotein-sorting protein
MNPVTERYSDLLGDQVDPALLACVADLDSTRAAFTLPPERDAAIAHALFTGEPLPVQRTLRPSLHRLISLPWAAPRWRLVPLLMAVLLVGSGLGVYVHGAGPTLVSAQTVLQRAAAASPGPNEASHTTYRLTAGGGYTGTAEVWVGTDAQGAPAEFAVTVTMAKAGRPAPDLSSQSVLNEQTLRVYDPASNTVTVADPGTSTQPLEGMLIGVLAGQKIGRGMASQQPTAAEALQQTLDGVSVYAVTIGRTGSKTSETETLYFDTRYYILDGADWVQAGQSWQARLDPASYRTMTLAAVPSHTFDLNTPANARTVTLAPTAAPTKSGGADPLITAAAAACHSTAQAFAAAVQAGDKSMLAICQETAPGMTAQQLVAALVASFKSSLDAQVASGTLTSAQEADQLAGLQTKLLPTVTGQPGTNPGGTKP